VVGEARRGATASTRGSAGLNALGFAVADLAHHHREGGRRLRFRHPPWSSRASIHGGCFALTGLRVQETRRGGLLLTGLVFVAKWIEHRCRRTRGPRRQALAGESFGTPSLSRLATGEDARRPSCFHEIRSIAGFRSEGAWS